MTRPARRRRQNRLKSRLKAQSRGTLTPKSIVVNRVASHGTKTIDPWVVSTPPQALPRTGDPAIGPHSWVSGSITNSGTYLLGTQ